MDSKRITLIKLGYSFGKFLLKIYPHIKLLAISGSLSNPRYRKHNDIDFFIVSKSGHVWDSLLVSILLSRIYSKIFGVKAKLFCFNYVIDENHVFDELNFDEKSAWEFLNLLVIHGHDVYLKIAIGKSKELSKHFELRFKKRIKRTIMSTHRDHRFSKLARLTSLVLMFTGKFLAFLLAPYIHVRERNWRYMLKELGLNYSKIYSNRYVYRRHKK